MLLHWLMKTRLNLFIFNIFFFFLFNSVLYQMMLASVLGEILSPLWDGCLYICDLAFSCTYIPCEAMPITEVIICQVNCTPGFSEGCWLLISILAWSGVRRILQREKTSLFQIIWPLETVDYSHCPSSKHWVFKMQRRTRMHMLR